MKKIAVISVKGGVGKTTTTVNLGHGLSLNGKRVILIDCDPQNNLADIFDLPGEGGLECLLRGRRAVISEVRRGLFVIPSGGRGLVEAEWELARGRDNFQVLGRELEDLANSDYVLLDCSSAMNLVNINALTFCDQVIIPVGMDYFSINGLKNTFELIRHVCQQTGHQLRLLGILSTMFDPRTRISREIYGLLYRMFPKEVFRTVIHSNVRLREAPAFGQTIFEYDIGSTGARDYIKLTAEVLAHDR